MKEVMEGKMMGKERVGEPDPGRYLVSRNLLLTKMMTVSNGHLYRLLIVIYNFK